MNKTRSDREHVDVEPKLRQHFVYDSRRSRSRTNRTENPTRLDHVVPAVIFATVTGCTQQNRHDHYFTARDTRRRTRTYVMTLSRVPRAHVAAYDVRLSGVYNARAQTSMRLGGGTGGGWQPKHVSTLFPVRSIS